MYLAPLIACSVLSFAIALESAKTMTTFYQCLVAITGLWLFPTSHNIEASPRRVQRGRSWRTRLSLQIYDNGLDCILVRTFHRRPPDDDISYFLFFVWVCVNDGIALRTNFMQSPATRARRSA